MAAGVLSFLTVGFVLSVFTGAPFLAGYLGGLEQGIAWLLLVAGLAYVGYYTDEIGYGFIFITLALLGIISMFLPGWMTRPFAGISIFLFGQTLGIDPVEFAVLAVTAVLLYWMLRARLFGRGKKPAALANRARTNAESVVRQYAKIFGTILGFLAAVVFLFGRYTGESLGEVFGFAANSPVIGGYLATIIGYFGAFFTDWPLISSFGPEAFFLAMVVLFLIVVGATYSSALD